MGKKFSRHDARKEAFKLIFELNQHKDELDFLFDNLLLEHPEAESSMPYIKAVVTGSLNCYDELIEIISENLAKGWTIDRISKPSRAILILAIYEIKYADDVPQKVAINEAVELAKEFDEPSAAAFVNGVLSGVIKNEPLSRG
ncbi:MAG: transcription antitermination factor NusB [Clostridia bacterium]|nr:transcription antitermination factor NusB [Clostridia bacterium]